MEDSRAVFGPLQAISVDERRWSATWPTGRQDVWAVAMWAKGPAVHPAQGGAIVVTHKSMWFRPGGSFDNSPAIHRWVRSQDIGSFVPEGQLKLCLEMSRSSVPTGRKPPRPSIYPAVNCWATAKRPSGTNNRRRFVCNNEGGAIVVTHKHRNPGRRCACPGLSHTTLSASHPSPLRRRAGKRSTVPTGRTRRRDASRYPAINSLGYCQLPLRGKTRTI
jgi:hypothetical protein